MQDDPVDVRFLMPLMREFGSLAHNRIGLGVTPIEYQRYLNLKEQIGQIFLKTSESGITAAERREMRSGRTRLVVSYAPRKALVESVIENIQPAGLLVPTPFAAEVGTRFLLRISLDREGEFAELPVIVVTSIAPGAHTLTTTNMGMSVKMEKMSAEQGAAVSKLFAHELDLKFGWAN